MANLSMSSYQPPVLDTPISVVWDLHSFNVILQNGAIQGGSMEFRCYPSKTSIGMKPALDVKTYSFYAADILAFQKANNLQPGAIAAMAYGLAQSIQDVVVAPAVPAVLDGDGNVVTPAVPAVMASFFANATLSNGI